MDLQETSYDIWCSKYQLKDDAQNPVDQSINDSFQRVANKLSSFEENQPYWEKTFYEAMQNGATPAGRIMSNAGAEDYKTNVSTINCIVSQYVRDSIEGIMDANKKAAISLAGGSGIGYEFSTLRPSGSFVKGAGAFTSGPLSFMDIFDSMCFTISSAGGRRGAQMATFYAWHPDVYDFISAKRQNARLRQFNMSLLIDDELIEAVKNDEQYALRFPVRQTELDAGYAQYEELIERENPWKEEYVDQMGYLRSENGNVLFKVYELVNARELWETIMKSTYDFSEPGVVFVDRINKMNNNWFCEKITSLNPCGEQPLPEFGSCLLGSINVAKFVKNPFEMDAYFDWEGFKDNVRVFSRMLDNVVEINGLPLQEQQNEIYNKRRHGMGILGLGSMFSLLGIQYGSDESVELTEEIMKTLAITGYEEGINLAREKGPAPILQDKKNRINWIESNFMKQIFDERPELKELAIEYGCRYTHAVSVAPTGTIALSINNNVSNGIEPTFSNHYYRNVIKEGRKTKEQVSVWSYEMLLYKEMFGTEEIPEWFSVADNVDNDGHIAIQSAVQKWTDSSVSKTVNVPSDIAFEDFKDLYIKGYEHGLKGLTTFRFNPDVFTGVLVREDDLESTTYVFETENGDVIKAKGSDTIEYDGEEHNAANLFDAIKENTYGKY